MKKKLAEKLNKSGIKIQSTQRQSKRTSVSKLGKNSETASLISAETKCTQLINQTINNKNKSRAVV